MPRLPHASLTLAVRKPCLGLTCTLPTPYIGIFSLIQESEDWYLNSLCFDSQERRKCHCRNSILPAAPKYRVAWLQGKHCDRQQAGGLCPRRRASFATDLVTRSSASKGTDVSIGQGRGNGKIP